MTAAIEQKNLQSVLQVAQVILKAGNKKLQKTSKKLDLIWANKKGIRNRLDCENKDQRLMKKKKPWTVEFCHITAKG